MTRTPRLHPRRPSRSTTLLAVAAIGIALPGLAVAATPKHKHTPAPKRTPAATATPAPTAAPSPSPSPSPVPSPSAAPSLAAPSSSPDFVRPSDSPSPTPAIAIRYGTVPAAGGDLAPGSYQDWSMGATLGFDVQDGWLATPVDAGFGLALVWKDQPAPAVLTLSTFDGLVFEDPCQADNAKTLTLPLTPDALAGDLAQSPDLVVGAPTDVTIAGRKALRLELGTQEPMNCPTGATWLWANKDAGGFVLEDGEQATLVLIPLDDSVLVASWEAYPGVDFAAFSKAAEQVVDSLTIDAAPSASPLPIGNTGPAGPTQQGPESPLPSASPAATAGPVV
ncbi:MAG: hypothetical protein U0869_18670 [Chloroflexota bacterium]